MESMVVGALVLIGACTSLLYAALTGIKSPVARVLVSFVVATSLLAVAGFVLMAFTVSGRQA